MRSGDFSVTYVAKDCEHKRRFFFYEAPKKQQVSGRCLRAEREKLNETQDLQEQLSRKCISSKKEIQKERAEN